MKLREVKHTEKLFGESAFDLHSNRFVLFDKDGNRINEWGLEKRYPNYLDLEVIKTAKSGYNSLAYFVGFPTTHIKLNIKDNDLLSSSKLKFGEEETDRAY